MQPSVITISREPELVFVTLKGLIEDRESEAWRTGLTEEIAFRGVPRFVVFDMFWAEMQSTMASRFEVAKYIREMMKRVDWAVLLMPKGVGSVVVVKLVMRIVSISNVSVASSRAELEEMLVQLRKGQRPYR